MVQILNEPKFPVIRELPDTREILQGFRASDWRNMTLATVLSAPFGFYAGKFLFLAHTSR